MEGITPEEIIKDEAGNELGRVVQLDPEARTMEGKDSAEMTNLQQLQAEHEQLEKEKAEIEEKQAILAEKIKLELDNQVAA